MIVELLLLVLDVQEVLGSEGPRKSVGRLVEILEVLHGRVVSGEVLVGRRRGRGWLVVGAWMPEVKDG